MYSPYKFAEKLFPINRSLTGDGVRETLKMVREILPGLQIHEVQSGTEVYDWTIPPEWNVTSGFILNKKGETIVDFEDNPLHIMSYSEPVMKWVTKEELDEHLFSYPEQPGAIPYITSYYNRDWGFCIQDWKRKFFDDKEYYVEINSELNENGSLTYADLVIPGKSEKEILFTTYICHPNLANNEVSGIVVSSYLARWILDTFTQDEREYTYRFVFVPETIGSIVYINEHFLHLKNSLEAGYVITCVGDDNQFSYMPSRHGNTLADKVAKHVLKNYSYGPVEHYSFLDRGSDERQYNSPLIKLPVCSVMRTKYGEYPEYHTSLDNLDFISENGLNGALDVYKHIVTSLELNHKFGVPLNSIHCEPQMGKRNLYRKKNIKGTTYKVRDMMNTLVYCDGYNDLIDISNITKQTYSDCSKHLKTFIEHEIIRRA